MLNRIILTLALFSYLSVFTLAQEKPEMHHMDHKHHNQKSLYVSETGNEIKALTNEELNHLLNGEGMGLAKAGELNSYPGPRRSSTDAMTSLR